MKTNFLTLIIIVFIEISSFSQTSYTKTYGDGINSESLYDVVKLNSGNYLLAGNIFYPNKQNGYLLEVDTLGNFIKEIKLTDSLNNYISLISACEFNEKYFTCGYISANSFFSDPDNIYVKATNSLGNNNWSLIDQSNSLENFAKKIIYKNDLLHILSVKNAENHYSKVSIITLDTLGQIVMNKNFIDSSYLYSDVYDFKILEDSSYLVIGFRYNLALNSNSTWLLKFDKLGNNILNSNLLTPNHGGYKNLLQLPDSNLVIVGSFKDQLNGQNSASSIVKLSINGSILFQNFNTTDSQNNEYLTCSSLNNDNSIIACGYNDKNVLVYKFDNLCNKIWVNILDNILNFGPIKIIKNNNDGYLIFGNYAELSNGIYINKIIIVSLDSLGRYNFATTINPITKEQESISIYPNPSNNIINIQTLHNEGIKAIYLYNNNGNLINTYFNNTKSIDLSNYANGNYYLKLQYKNNYETKKILKN